MRAAPLVANKMNLQFRKSQVGLVMGWATFILCELVERKFADIFGRFDCLQSRMHYICATAQIRKFHPKDHLAEPQNIIGMASIKTSRFSFDERDAISDIHRPSDSCRLASRCDISS